MPLKREADEDSIFELPQLKKQVPSCEIGIPAQSKSTGGKQAVDVEHYAVPRELLNVGDCFHTVYIELAPSTNDVWIVNKNTLIRCSGKLADILERHHNETEPDLAESVKKRSGLEYFLKLEYFPTINSWLLIRDAFTIPKSNSAVHQATDVKPDEWRSSAVTLTMAASNEKFDNNIFTTVEPAVNPSVKFEDGTSTPREPGSAPVPAADNTTNLGASTPCYAHDDSLDLSSASKKLPSSNGDEMRLAFVEAHNNLLLLFHGKEPKLDSNNISNAIAQIEPLGWIAYKYKCLPLVRLHLNNHLFQFGRELYEAVLENPPRWLFLSHLLACAPVYKEAMVHIIGQYPLYPWSKKPSSKLTPHLGLIRKKADELKILKASINEELFNSSICIDGRRLSSLDLRKADFDTWFIVQLWQDWLRESLSKQSAAEHGVGTTYRLMAEGGNAYLDACTVYSKLRANKNKSLGTWNLRKVGEDLKIMTDFAQKTVKSLVINNSFLAVEEFNIQHLTCTKIENEDLPWFKKDNA